MVNCLICDKQFSKTFNLNRHLLQIHKQEGAVAKRKFKKDPGRSAMAMDGTSISTTAASVSRTQRAGNYGLCCETLFSPQEYKIHLLDNHLYKCPVCHFQSKHKSSLTQHYKSHSRTTPETCPECSKSFKSRKSLKFHMKSIHHCITKIYECGCGYKTVHRSTFRRHEGKCSPKNVSVASPGVMSDEQTFLSSDDSDQQKPLDANLQPETPIEQEQSLEQALIENQGRPSSSKANEDQELLSTNLLFPSTNHPSLVEWITGYGHPRTLKTEKRKFSCHVPNCLLTFSRFYDFKRHFSACHQK